MKKKILIIATSQITIESFLIPHIQKLKSKHEITVLTKFKNSSFNIPKVKIYNINLNRKINFINDLKNLIYLINFLRSNFFNLVFTITPKAGLLGMLSAFINKVPCRIHIFTGQVWCKKNFFFKYLLKLFDKFIMLLTHQTLCDGKSQRKFLIENSFSTKIKVLGNGSICGVDTNFFKPNNLKKKNLRKKLKIKSNETIFLYVGRINRDKGIYNILKVSKMLSDFNYKFKFFFVGNYEDKKLQSEIKKNKNIIHFNHSKNIISFYQLADIFVTASYREGFGMTVAQAMSCGLPIIGTNIYGLKDLLKNGNNCLTFEPDNIDKLFLNCCRLIENKKLRTKFGLNGRNKIIQNFQQQNVIKYYEKFINVKLDV